MGAGPVIKCNGCGDRIQSMHRHDMNYCSCKATAIDGGDAYTRILYKDEVGYEFLGEAGQLSAEQPELSVDSGEVHP